ncbi:substrate-binding periplasmic protein [Vogesella oryzae]|uniref:substrate-binding periplasmic protein n=1 Tax=Vogesella oryzae TaxID=1735285 RepID=UPI001C2EA4A4|nr:transporter substrate-binding domain-containing protein [Vogesella oryzae]
MSRNLMLLFLLLCPLSTLGAETPLQVRFSNPAYPPFLGEQLAQGGIMSAVVREVFRRGNVSVSYSWYPNNRALQLARSGGSDGSLGWTPNEERQQDLLFSEQVVPFRMVLFQRVGESYPWQTLADLAPYRIGITAGNFYSDDFSRLQQQGVLKVDIAGDDNSNLRKLLVGRIDLFPMEWEAGQLLVHSQLRSVQARKLVPQAREYWTTPLCVALSRKNPQAPELLARFNRELRKMRSSGELARLITRTRQQVYDQLGIGEASAGLVARGSS